MNKQEALEGILVKCREWEQRTEEVKAVHGTQVADVMHRNVMRLLDMREAEVAGAKLDDAEFKAALFCVGAAALYLLVDEVEVVEGRSLEEWLANNADRSGTGGRMHLPSGRPQVHLSPQPVTQPSVVLVQPVNGTIGKRLPRHPKGAA